MARFSKLGHFPASAGWYPGQTVFSGAGVSGPGIRTGLLSQNNISAPDDGQTLSTTAADASSNTFYSDPDGVIRRAMAAWVVPSGTHPATSVLGLPLATANTITNGQATRKAQSSSRPVILNRPFRSVAELGYVFSDTPWKNLDLTTPESGDSALLDVYCINDTNDSNSLVAGKVNLNTRQYPVLQAILAGAYQDDWTGATVTLTSATGDPGKIAGALVARTTNTTVNGQAPPSTTGPLANLSELVGKWNNNAITITTSGAASPDNIDGSQSYRGFIGDSNITTILGANNVVPRYREAIVRALAASTTTRVWNLMIDVIAQTGRFPSSATGLASFNVEGERRYWVHVAIDRYTGKVLDEQVEEVKE